MTEYATFAKFRNIEEAHPLISMLVENNIPYVTQQERNQLDPIIIGNSMDPMLVVNIPVDQFTAANQIIGELTRDAPPEIYLPERLHTKWIIIGYIFSLFSFAGLFGGLSIITATKRLADGRKINMYDRHTIRHGRIMLIIGIISTILWLLYQFQHRL